MFKKIVLLLSVGFWVERIELAKLSMLHPIYQKYIVPRKVKALRKKEVIKVLFVVNELGSWKTENLFQMMSQHPRFNAQLLLAPSKDTPYSYDIVKEYLERRGYIYETLNVNENIRKKINPDIIFYGKPYMGILENKYFYSRNLYALFCYVLYSFRNRNSQHLRKVVFFDFTWQLYAENKKVIEEMYDILNTRGKNMVYTGFPVMDVLLQGKQTFPNPWQIQVGKKRIIYAPHYTIYTEQVKSNSPIDYSTFLEYSDFMLEMAMKYKDKVQWAFKPHPLLKKKLYLIWGEERTNSYYQKWQDMENTQIDEGEYIGLFKHSDAMIHDCGSFKLEYLYTGNPVMYLIKKDQKYDYPNWQTQEALKLHYHGHYKEDIEKFIQDVISGVDSLKEQRNYFVQTYLTPPHGKSACENIINAILGEAEYS